MTAHRRVGASDRARPDAPDRTAAAGPPPEPLVELPWSLTAVASSGPEVELVCRWMSAPHVDTFWQQAWPLTAWRSEIRRQHSGEHSRPWIVNLGDEPVGYVEVYRVARDLISDAWPAGAHDLGIHVAIGDPGKTRRGLGRRLLDAVATGLERADPRCERILADPAADNEPARRCFRAAGFELLDEVELPHKRAALMARRVVTGANGSAPK